MIKIPSPYSNEYRRKYWNWFQTRFNFNDSSRLSDLFKLQKYSLKKDFLLKSVIICPTTYVELSRYLEPISNSDLKYDMLHEYDLFVDRKPQSLDSCNQCNAYSLYKEINIKICPYCNLNNISLYYEADGKKRGHIDHFFDKATYPYLSLSLYNLVPCCSTCNSSFKGSTKFDIESYVHPYFEEFGENAKFIVQVNEHSSKDILSLSNSSNFDIAFSFSNNSTKQVNNNIAFQLAKDSKHSVVGVYQDEKDYVLDILRRMREYCEHRC